MRSETITQVVLGMAITAGAISLAAAADPRGADKDMVLIPKGEFAMGSSEHSDEFKHQVVLDAYRIDKYETSNARYKEFMKATNHPAPAYWDDPRLSKPNQPLVGVSWTDANAFCQYEGRRLPTEAEWERAAKGPDGDNQPDNNSYGVGLGFRCAKSAQTVSEEAMQESRDAFIQRSSRWGLKSTRKQWPPLNKPWLRTHITRNTCLLVI